MGIITEPLSYELLQRALLGGIAVVAATGPIAGFVVGRGLASCGGRRGHARIIRTQTSTIMGISIGRRR